MKTTLNLPDALIREVKIRAAQENRKLQDLLAELIQRGLGLGPACEERDRRRVQLPLILCAHAARPDQEMTAERVAELLLDDEARRCL